MLQTEKVRQLQQIIDEKPEKKDQILNNIFELVATLVKKGLLYLSIAHHLIQQYFENASLKQQIEMAASLVNEIVHTVRTKRGTEVAAKCIALATVKQRKAIVKSFKSNFALISKEKFGHMVIVKLLDTLDDTVLLLKTVIQVFFIISPPSPPFGRTKRFLCN